MLPFLPVPPHQIKKNPCRSCTNCTLIKPRSSDSHSFDDDWQQNAKLAVQKLQGERYDGIHGTGNNYRQAGCLELSWEEKEAPGMGFIFHFPSRLSPAPLARHIAGRIDKQSVGDSGKAAADAPSS
jgi:hypothetical protein